MFELQAQEGDARPVLQLRLDLVEFAFDLIVTISPLSIV